MIETGLIPKLVPAPKLSTELRVAYELLIMPMMRFEQHLQTLLAENPMLEEYEDTEEEDRYTPEYRSSERRSERTDPTEYLTQQDCSLQTYLMDQLPFLRLSEQETAIATYLIGGIEDNGMFVDDPGAVSDVFEVTTDEVETVLQKIQTLDPPGVGARNHRECLMIQLVQAGEENSLAMRLLRDHWEDVRILNGDQLKRHTKLPEQDIKAALKRIALLNPNPGYSVGQDLSIHVVPDVIVDQYGDRYEVRLNKQFLPALRLSETYAGLRDRLPHKNDRVWLTEKMGEARLLIKAMELRDQTLMKVAKHIVERQQAFFNKGPKHLKPMIMQEVADEVGVDVSTVSRAQSGKYMQTPQGVYSMKSFFTTAIKNEDGGTMSNRVVKDHLEELIRNEDPAHPMSDAKLAEAMQRNGISIQRRTVAKYREELGILTARDRKKITDLRD